MTKPQTAEQINKSQVGGLVLTPEDRAGLLILATTDQLRDENTKLKAALKEGVELIEKTYYFQDYKLPRWAREAKKLL